MFLLIISDCLILLGLRNTHELKTKEERQKGKKTGKDKYIYIYCY